jgi:hypothetical protein
MLPSLAALTRQPWYRRTKRTLRRYREVIVIILTIAMSLGFLLVGYIVAVMMESQHPTWFGGSY